MNKNIEKEFFNNLDVSFVDSNSPYVVDLLNEYRILKNIIRDKSLTSTDNNKKHLNKLNEIKLNLSIEQDRWKHCINTKTRYISYCGGKKFVDLILLIKRNINLVSKAQNNFDKINTENNSIDRVKLRKIRKLYDNVIVLIDEYRTLAILNEYLIHPELELFFNSTVSLYEKTTSILSKYIEVP